MLILVLHSFAARGRNILSPTAGFQTPSDKLSTLEKLRLAEIDCEGSSVVARVAPRDARDYWDVVPPASVLEPFASDPEPPPASVGVELAGSVVPVPPLVVPLAPPAAPALFPAEPPLLLMTSISEDPDDDVQAAMMASA